MIFREKFVESGDATMELSPSSVDFLSFDLLSESFSSFLSEELNSIDGRVSIDNLIFYVTVLHMI